MAFSPLHPLSITTPLALLFASCAATYQVSEEPLDHYDYEYDRQDPRQDGRVLGRDQRGRNMVNDERYSKFEFQFVYSDQELDQLELDLDGTTTTADLFDLDRRRVELRFGFGHERSRGRFFVFGESFGDDVAAQLSSSDELDVAGIGGGMSGAPYIGRGSADPYAPRFVIPYEWDIAAAYGDEDDSITVGYAELRASVGIGIEWNGIRPHAGVNLSAISGVIDNDGSVLIDNSEFSGFNAGVYGEVRFNPPGTPLVLRGRIIRGDIDSTELGFGVQI